MTDHDRFEARFEAWVRADAATASRPSDAAAIAHAAIVAARRGGTRWWAMGASASGWPMRALTRAVLIALLVALLAALAVLIGGQLRPTPAPVLRGVITRTEHMVTTRLDSWSMTRLLDGRVLVAGGVGGGFDNAAELFDPATDEWRPTGSLAPGRSGHTATLLPDGRVLIVGGTAFDGHGTAALAVWDPTTEAFGDAGTLATTPIEGVQVRVMEDGRALIRHSEGAEVWDPATMSLSPAGPLDDTPPVPDGATLPDGRVLFVADDAVRVWDPTTGRSAPGMQLPPEHRAYWVVALADGPIVAFGSNGRSVCTQAEARTASTDTAGLKTCTTPPFVADVWDPATGATTTTEYDRDFEGGTAVALLDGRALVAGRGAQAVLFELQR